MRPPVHFSNIKILTQFGGFTIPFDKGLFKKIIKCTSEAEIKKLDHRISACILSEWDYISCEELLKR